MKKTAVTLILFLTFFLCNMTAARAELMLEYDGGVHEYNGSIFTLIVNDSVIKPPLSPIIFNDHALVPVREIFEELGAEVDYEDDTKRVDVIKDEYTVSLAINDNVAYINGERKAIPDGVAPKLISEYGGETKTMVPVRFISESIGLDVDFDEEHGAILVESSDYVFDGEMEITPMTPEPRKTAITYIDCKTNGSNTLKIVVSADGIIGDTDSFEMKNPDRFVIDIYGVTFNNSFSDKTVNKIGIEKIRFGENNERARIVIDSSMIERHEIKKLNENQIEIDIITKEEETAIKTPEPERVTPVPKPQITPAKPTPEYTPVPTPKPTPKPTPTPVPTPIVYKNIPDTDKLIVLDAGHGGSDSGAVGYLNGNMVLEKNLTLEITNKVKKHLEDDGYKVLLTRSSDTIPSLAERPAKANAEDAAVFVSIHINSVENAPEASGTEVFYAASNNGSVYKVNSKTLASNILSRMIYYTGSVNRGVKTAEHAVTKRCNMPASLVEVGFITNPTEVYNMTSDEYQNKAAQGIAEGIIMTLRDVGVPQRHTAD